MPKYFKDEFLHSVSYAVLKNKIELCTYSLEACDRNIYVFFIFPLPIFFSRQMRDVFTDFFFFFWTKGWNLWRSNACKMPTDASFLWAVLRYPHIPSSSHIIALCQVRLGALHSIRFPNPFCLFPATEGDEGPLFCVPLHYLHRDQARWQVLRGTTLQARWKEGTQPSLHGMETRIWGR